MPKNQEIRKRAESRQRPRDKTNRPYSSLKEPMLKNLHAFAFTLLASVISIQADDAAVKKYRNFTPEQIAKLPNEQRESQVPMMYTMAANRGLGEGTQLLFGMELNQLMYPGLHNYDSAVKAFQVDLSDKPTGKLTVWQIHQLEKRAEMQQLSRIIFPDQFYSDISEEYATVFGTATILDDNILNPINHVKLKCFKATGQCEYSQISLSVPNESSWSQTYSIIDQNTEYYSVSRWEDHIIESHPLGGSKACRNTSLSLNFKTKEFYFITRNAGGDCKVFGGELDKLKKPRISQIVDGGKIILAEFAKVKKKSYEALSSDFRKKAEALIKSEQEKAGK